MNLELNVIPNAQKIPKNLIIMNIIAKQFAIKKNLLLLQRHKNVLNFLIKIHFQILIH